MSDSLQPNELQHVRLPCPSLSPGVCSNSCPLRRRWSGVEYVHCVCSWMLPNCPQKWARLVYILTKTMSEYFFSSHPCQNFIFTKTEIFCCSDYCSVLKLIIANACRLLISFQAPPQGLHLFALTHLIP